MTGSRGAWTQKLLWSRTAGGGEIRALLIEDAKGADVRFEIDDPDKGGTFDISVSVADARDLARALRKVWP